MKEQKELSEKDINKLILEKLGLFSHSKMYQCPFHTDNHPSMSIDVEKGIYHCFSCQDSGTLRSLFYKIKGYGINKELGIKSMPRIYDNSEKKENTKQEASEFSEMLEPKNDDSILAKSPKSRVSFEGNIISVEYSDLAKNYLKKRCISVSVANKMGFKFSINAHSYDEENPSDKSKYIYFTNRLLVPVYENGKMISCEGRNVFSKEEFINYYRRKRQHPKEYKKCIYPKGSSTNTLFQLDGLKKDKDVFVVEGIMDLAVLRSDNFFNEHNSTSTFGCALTKRQLYLLSQFDNVTFIIDNDLAGWSEIHSVREYLIEKKLFKNWYFLIPPFENLGVKDVGDIPVKASKSITDCLKANWLCGRKSILLSNKLINSKLEKFKKF